MRLLNGISVDAATEHVFVKTKREDSSTPFAPGHIHVFPSALKFLVCSDIGRRSSAFGPLHRDGGQLLGRHTRRELISGGVGRRTNRARSRPRSHIRWETGTGLKPQIRSPDAPDSRAKSPSVRIVVGLQIAALSRQTESLMIGTGN